MTSQFSSKKEKELTFVFGDTGELHSLPAPILTLLSLYEKCLDYAKAAIKSDWSPWMRDIAGVFACASVAVYVAGYTCGYWVHRLNDRISAWPLFLRKKSHD
jgi:hypothetical protein